MSSRAKLIMMEYLFICYLGAQSTPTIVKLYFYATKSFIPNGIKVSTLSSTIPATSMYYYYLLFTIFFVVSSIVVYSPRGGYHSVLPNCEGGTKGGIAPNHIADGISLQVRFSTSF